MPERMKSGAADDPAKRLFSALCSLKSADDAKSFLLDLLSTKELEELTQRFEVAYLLDRGRSYVDVSALTGASSTTVSRVSKCLNGSVGGYRLVLDRICKR